LPAGSVTYMAHVLDMQLQHASALYGDAGIFLRESSSGKIVTFGCYDFGASTGFTVTYYTGPTSYSSNITQTGSSYPLNPNVQTPVSQVGLYRPLWLRFRIASGTVYCEYSTTAADNTWVTFTSFSAASYFTSAPDGIGIYIENIETTIVTCVAVDSFLRTA
jgi:hypothetical protein